MGLRSFVTGLFGEKAKQAQTVLAISPGYQTGFALAGGTSEIPKLIKEGYKQNAVVYGCMRTRATAVAEAPLRWYACDKTGEHQLDDFPARALIARPNPYQTEYEFWDLTMTFLLICGKALWWKERANNGLPIRLWPLRADRMEPVLGSMPKLIAEWDYQINGEHFPVPTEDILYFNLSDPADATGGIAGGLGPLQVLAREIDTDNEATKMVYAMLRNHASPGVVIKAKGSLTKEEADRAKEKFVEKYGDMRRGVPAVVDGDTDIIPIGFTLQQLEFPALRDRAESRISAVFQTPAILAHLQVGLEHATYANVEQLRYYWTEEVISQDWRRLSDDIQLQLTPDFQKVYPTTRYDQAPMARFDVSKVKALATHQIEVAERYFRLYGFGVLTKNEMRAKLGLDALATGDVFYLPTLGQEIPADESAQQIPDVGSAGRRRASTKAADPGQALRRLHGKRVAKLASVLDPKLKAYFDDQKTAVLKRWEQTHKSRPRMQVKDDFDLLPKDALAKLLQLLQQHWTAALDSAHDDTEAYIGSDFDLANDHVQKVLDQVATRVTGITDTTRDDIRKVVSQQLDQGASSYDIRDALEGLYDESYANRSLTIARTESAVAYNAGTTLSYRESGVVDEVTVYDAAECGRPECEDADGATWTLDEADAEPTAHPSCSRSFSPVVSTDARRVPGLAAA